MFSDAVQWLNDKTLFRRDKPIPPIGFKYNQQFTGEGTNTVNTLGSLVTIREILSFGVPSFITRLDLTFTVQANTFFAIVGAAIVKNSRLNETFSTGQSNTILMGSTTILPNAVIAKTFNFGPYGGYRMETNESLWLAIRGDGTAITLEDVTVYWVTAPGAAMISEPR